MRILWFNLATMNPPVPLDTTPRKSSAVTSAADLSAGPSHLHGTAKKGSGLGSTLKVSALTLGSRILGLAREQLLAALLGAGNYSDAFLVAFRIPNLLRDLFAEGALSAAFVPTFAKVEADKGKSAAHELANRVAGALLIILGILTILGVIFAKPLVLLLAPGFAQQAGKIELTAFLAQIMMPFLPLVSLAALLMGMLNARGKFGIPALAPSLFNVAAIVVGLGLKFSGASPQNAVIGWSIGTILGGGLQLVSQIPQLWRDGYRLLPKFHRIWKDESLRKIAKLMAPATVGLAATQVNIFVNTEFASNQPGANSWLGYAFRLIYLPIGIFGVAIATVTASSLAKSAAKHDIQGIKIGLAQGLRHVAFLTIPSTVGLVVLAEPVIRLIYEHGCFSSEATKKTAAALICYSLGLYAYSGVKVAAPAFYSVSKTKVPLIASIAAVATNLVLNFLANKYIGYLGLAIGTSLGAIVNLSILAFSFRSLTIDHQSQISKASKISSTPYSSSKRPALAAGVIVQLTKVLIASGVMGGIVWAAMRELKIMLSSHNFSVNSFGVNSVIAISGIFLGILAYCLACKALQVSELSEVMKIARRRKG